MDKYLIIFIFLVILIILISIYLIYKFCFKKVSNYKIIKPNKLKIDQKNKVDIITDSEKEMEIPKYPQKSKIINFQGIKKLGGRGNTFIYVIDNFLTQEECQKIINSSRGRLEPSKLSRPVDDNYYRNSETGYFSQRNKFHQQIEEKICRAMGIPNRMSEGSQIQFYNKGKQFKNHYDYFEFGNKKEFNEHVKNRGQRTWTFMIYLNNVKEGGETSFPKQNISIKPETGRAVIWYNLLKNGSGNEYTLHSGTPVKKGIKYIITKWFRSKSQYS